MELNYMYLTPDLKFTVPGPPVPKARTRSGRWGHFTPQRTVEYEKRIKKYARLAAKRDKWELGEYDKYRLSVFVFRQYHRGDLDNYVKSVSDALNGIVWGDDRNVWELNCHMRTSRDNPRTVICVSVLATDELENMHPGWE